MDWKPLTRVDLDAIIASGLAGYDDDVRAEWERIRIEPARWQCSPWGDEGGGFWAVAIDDGEVVWFNDIEDGFNRSHFPARGIIGDYRCNQTSFQEILGEIERRQAARASASLASGCIPAELTGPGRIAKRQTTYWTLRTETGLVWRVLFERKAEFAYVDGAYERLEIQTKHPLLVQHDEPSRSLYFLGTPLDPRRVVAHVDAVIRRVSDGWRSVADYADSVENAIRVLRGGYGLMMQAPESVCAAVGECLERSGLSTSMLGSAPGRRGHSALLLGRSYVIATRFTFARRDD
jgi:hypothetical protein